MKRKLMRSKLLMINMKTLPEWLIQFQETNPVEKYLSGLWEEENQFSHNLEDMLNTKGPSAINLKLIDQFYFNKNCIGASNVDLKTFIAPIYNFLQFKI